MMRGLYLLHFEPRYKHAGHYLGYSSDIDKRVKEHMSGGAAASPLVRAALAAGCEVTVARIHTRRVSQDGAVDQETGRPARVFVPSVNRHGGSEQR